MTDLRKCKLTAKVDILKQTLEAAKTAQEGLNKVGEENQRLQSALSEALEAAKTGQADKEKAIKDALESAQQALKVKEDEIQRQLKRDAMLVSSSSSAKSKLRNLDVSDRRKSFIFILHISCSNIHRYR